MMGPHLESAIDFVVSWSCNPTASFYLHRAQNLLFEKSSANSFHIFFDKTHHPRSTPAESCWENLFYDLLLPTCSSGEENLNFLLQQHGFLDSRPKNLFPGDKIRHEVWLWEAVNCGRNPSLPVIYNILKQKGFVPSGKNQGWSLSTDLHTSTYPNNWQVLEVWLLERIWQVIPK